jgi:hypothetical protein
VLVSLRAASVRQAQQTLSLAFLFLFIPLFLIPLLPESLRDTVSRAASGMDIQIVGIMVVALLLVVDLVLLATGMRLFNRARLILNQS